MRALGALDDLDLLDGLGLRAQLAEVGLEGSVRAARIDPDADSPFADEQALVARAVGARRAELFSGRHLARRALADLGVSAGGLGRRPDRSPDWPAGVIGSISHSEELVVVAVARPRPPGVAGAGPAVARRAGVGIDVQADRPLPDGVADRVLTSDERSDGADPVVVFSAKEAVFKALNPLTGRWLEPEDVTVRVAPGAFEARLTTRGAGAGDPSRVAGGWIRLPGWVLTACVVTAGPGASR
jgi:4'-phosphopantetheinyl transferase EntD